jgi:hypothetical protein
MGTDGLLAMTPQKLTLAAEFSVKTRSLAGRVEWAFDERGESLLRPASEHPYEGSRKRLVDVGNSWHDRDALARLLAFRFSTNVIKIPWQIKCKAISVVPHLIMPAK